MTIKEIWCLGLHLCLNGSNSCIGIMKMCNMVILDKGNGKSFCGCCAQGGWGIWFDMEPIE
jgi:hypothetical protein